MAETGRIKVDPLFVGLTRPTMFLGVSQGFVMLNAFINILYFIWSSNLLVIFTLVFFHMIGYILCFKEPLFVELFMIKSQKCGYGYNGLFYHGANSYDMY